MTVMDSPHVKSRDVAWWPQVSGGTVTLGAQQPVGKRHKLTICINLLNVFEEGMAAVQTGAERPHGQGMA